MPKNYNIQTVCKKIATKGVSVAIGSSVAAGMNRYVTFIQVAQDIAAGGINKGSKVYFCSGTTSTYANETLASAAQKLSIQIASGIASGVSSRVIQIPKQPDTENPLFSVAASKVLSAKLGSTVAGTSAAVTLFVQYYDQ